MKRSFLAAAALAALGAAIPGAAFADPAHELGGVTDHHVGGQRVEGPNAEPGSDVDGGRLGITGVATRKIDGAFHSAPRDGSFLGRAGLVPGAKYNF